MNKRDEWTKIICTTIHHRRGRGYGYTEGALDRTLIVVCACECLEGDGLIELMAASLGVEEKAFNLFSRLGR